MKNQSAALIALAGVAFGGVTMTAVLRANPDAALVSSADAAPRDRTFKLLANTARITHGDFQVAAVTGEAGAPSVDITLNVCGFAQTDAKGETPDTRCVKWKPTGAAANQFAAFLSAQGLPVLRKRLGLE